MGMGLGKKTYTVGMMGKCPHTISHIVYIVDVHKWENSDNFPFFKLGIYWI